MRQKIAHSFSGRKRLRFNHICFFVSRRLAAPELLSLSNLPGLLFGGIRFFILFILVVLLVTLDQDDRCAGCTDRQHPDQDVGRITGLGRCNRALAGCSRAVGSVAAV